MESLDKKTAIRQKKRRFTIGDFELTMLSAPAAILLVLFCYLPMFGIIIAFKNFQIAGSNYIMGLLKSPWCGFANFKYLFATSDAYIILRNTIGYNLIFMALGVAIPVTLAIMLSELLNTFLAKTYQTMMLLPYFLSWVVVSGFVYVFLAPGQGIANQVLQYLHLGTVQWYTDVKVWPFLLTFFNVWKNFGYQTVIYLAAIAGIDRTLYEAAQIDGASKIQQAVYILIPGIKTIIVILLLLALGSVCSGDFGLFYLVPRQSGPLYNVTEIIDIYVYGAISGTGSMGMSAAAAFFQSVVGCVMLVISNLFIRKIDPESALF